MSAAIWVALLALAGAVSLHRWWYWKREAYRTRDAAFRSFESIKKTALGQDNYKDRGAA